MEKVEGLMRDLKLSAAEQCGTNLGGKEGRAGREADCKALGKIMSDKSGYADGLAASLGRIWCPLKGVRCKDMGGNVFLFTFPQGAGKRKALFDGPWMVNNDLIVMTDFDLEKSLEEHVFDTIPIWIRVWQLPLGWMNREDGMEIGDLVGESVAVDVEEDGTAVGEYLRIKVRINISVPLLRGTTINVGENKQARWCPFEYEYLPEFCYTCGILGHDDKSCVTKLGKGERQQFGSWLRAQIPKKSLGGGRGAWSEGRLGRGSSSYGFSGSGGRRGSDSPSWRRDAPSGGRDTV
jgi:hypothetical protein